MRTGIQAGEQVQVRKVKWPLPDATEPRSVSEWDARVLGTDQFGTWLFCGEGEIHRGSNGESWVVPSDGVQLLPDSGWWAAWWWRTDRWISVDICTPPALGESGWSYVDLELDLARLADGTVLLVDEDEFEQTVVECRISADVVAEARAAAADLQIRLADVAVPVVAAGWEWIDRA
ncbi:DUF402 domain-containing protein [Streptomyces griseorubiginosus]|uniref:DUF402 domain-containing protein n=1 Tax=Streptomyces griseorubiginosus TaxID=67304 RepID=UPI001AD71C40|nr:DUF402 domain-containing protein [Streptomyces griseorubiginosus]MBO4259213.1 DUF402 domain-containing protein [Streptomyces griseorubiginosus]